MPRRQPLARPSILPGWNPEAWQEERQARREAIDEAVAMIEGQGYYMDRQTQELCDAFIAGRFTPDEIVGSLLKSRLH